MRWILGARWVVPVSSPPLKLGRISIEGERIVETKEGGGPADVDLGNAVVFPGLVNCHTHLDLSGLAGQCPPTAAFPDWLRRVVKHRRSTGSTATEEHIRNGLEQVLRSGATLVGDIASQGVSFATLNKAPIWSVVFYELLGLTIERASAAENEAQRWLHGHWTATHTRQALSPHAPYSVRNTLYDAANRLARKHRLLLATHLAESQAEGELLRRQRGEFVPFLKELGVWDPSGLLRDWQEVVERMTRGGVRALLIHGNYLASCDWLPSHCTMVYCPRTHAAFGHGPHPFRDWLDRGIRVALGTDSLASNPDLDILEEVRFLARQCPDLDSAELLKMVTLNGAWALGFEHETGTLEAGKSADLAVIELGEEDVDDPYAAILKTTRPVSRVLWRGQWR
ncbi:MAG: chlorohydrolase [Gemmatales bacterium]|nr:MAG: chlorohydrolase [Gemmatales bacterium]